MSDQARDTALQAAIDAVGGVGKLAEALGIRSEAVSQWKRTPATRVLTVERLTGGRVTRHQLRPDLYPDESPDDDTPTPPDEVREAAQ